MKNKLFCMIGIMTLSAGLIAGCGSTQKPAEPAKEEAAAEEKEEAAEEETEEESVSTPFLADLEAYDEIISTLKPGQAYAFADMDEDNDALLVTDSVYDNQDGNMAAIDAVIYGFDNDGKIIEYGPVFSEGTAYPLAVYDGCLIFGGNHHVGLEFINESVSSIITKEDASEVFDEKGNATYFYFSYDDEFEGEVEDNSKLEAMYEKYAEAVVINFTVVE